MPIIIEPDQEAAERHLASIGGALRMESVDAVEEHLRHVPREYAVVLGASVDVDAALGLAARVRTSHPQVSLLLLRKHVEGDVLQRAMRSGIREVLDADDGEELAEAVSRAKIIAEAMLGPVLAQPSGSARMITVFSTKGGVGKSLVATNLAVALADQGHRVCLVDLDVHCGDVAIMLQLAPTRSLSDLPTFGGEIDAGAVEALSIAYSDHLSVIAAPVQLDGVDDVTAAATSMLLDQVRQQFDVVVVDTVGLFDDHALAALTVADHMVLVGTLDIPSLKNLKLALTPLSMLDLPRDRWHLVVNRADSRVGITVKEYAETLELPVAAELPSDREILAAVNRGEPIVRALPKHASSSALKSLARDLVHADATHTSTARRGLFRRSKKEA